MNYTHSPSLTAIIKPIYECNLGCLYCYEGDHPQPVERMSFQTLRNVLTHLAEYHGLDRKTRIIWHGGEPLLMGLDFYRQVMEIQAEIGSQYVFENSIQTNATLITDETLDFFEENNFSVGTSLDGPRWVHDFTRPFLDGSSSFDMIFSAVQCMNDRPKIDAHKRVGGGVIAVLTRPILAHLDEFYDFFLDHRIPVKINPIFYTGRGNGVREQIGITATEYGEAMIHLFERWFYEPECVIDVDPFSLILGNLITNQPNGCQFGSDCFDKFIAVDPSGDVYPCGRWSSYDSVCLGNLNAQSLSEIRLSPVLDRFRLARQQALQSCLPCQFRSICNSGCIENGYLIRQQLNDRDMYCKGYKMLFSRIKAALDEELVLVPTDQNEFNIPQTSILAFHDLVLTPSQIGNPSLQRVIKQRIADENRVLAGYNDYSRSHTDHNRYSDHSNYSDHSDYHCP